MNRKALPNSETRKYSILLVDDHPVVREGFAKLISEEPDLRVCGQASNAGAAWEAVHKLKPDLVVLDISLNGANGMELLKRLTVFSPKLPVLVLSMHDESVYGERALRAGARGYIMKQAPTEEVMHAIREVLRGLIYLSPQMHSRVVARLLTGDAAGESSIERLSDRELEVFELIGRGHKTGEIARELNLSVKTIETYRAQIKSKIRLKNSTELAGQAARWVSLQQQFP